MYAKMIVHRDLKLDNILISFPKLGTSLTKEDLLNIDLSKEEFVIKIADFGFSRELRDG
jgi:serine/threonine protein kinase